MKKSLYNFLFLCEGDWVLFNLATEEMSLLDAKVKQIYEENDMEGIRRLHPDFYAFLTEKRFAVPDDETKPPPASPAGTARTTTRPPSRSPSTLRSTATCAAGTATNATTLTAP